MYPDDPRHGERNVSLSIDRVIDACIGQLEGLKVKLPAARRSLLAELHTVGEPGAASYDPPIRGHREHTPTEAGALTLDHLRTQLDGLSHELNAVALILRNLHADCDRIIGTRITKPRCDGGVGREGYLIPKEDGGWSTPDCWAIPPEGAKTCDRCSSAATLWKRRRDDAERKRSSRRSA